MLSFMEQTLNYKFLVVNLESTRGSLNPQGDKSKIH